MGVIVFFSFFGIWYIRQAEGQPVFETDLFKLLAKRCADIITLCGSVWK